MNNNLPSLHSLRQSKITPELIIDHLSKSPLLAKYLRVAIIEEQLELWSKSQEFKSICKKNNPIIIKEKYQFVLFDSYKKSKFTHLVRSRFLSQKSQLDRVLFSVIQVKDIRFAQELYCRITEQHQSFCQLATTYSNGSTAKQGGSIGPINYLQLYPQIQHYLRGLKVQQLSPIFQIDEDYVFLKLDRWLPAQLNPQTAYKLLDELFEEWLQQQIIDRIGKIQLVISSPIIEESDLLKSSGSEIFTSKNVDHDTDLIENLISPTSSFFFPEISPMGQVLPPNPVTNQSYNSSFFITQPSTNHSVDRIKKQYPNISLKKIVTFIVFFSVFLGGGIKTLKFFSNPVTSTINSK
jgi:PPIC-type PPIASE domain